MGSTVFFAESSGRNWYPVHNDDPSTPGEATTNKYADAMKCASFTSDDSDSAWTKYVHASCEEPDQVVEVRKIIGGSHKSSNEHAAIQFAFFSRFCSTQTLCAWGEYCTDEGSCAACSSFLDATMESSDGKSPGCSVVNEDVTDVPTNAPTKPPTNVPTETPTEDAISYPDLCSGLENKKSCRAVKIKDVGVGIEGKFANKKACTWEKENKSCLPKDPCSVIPKKKKCKRKGGASCTWKKKREECVTETTGT